MLSGEVCRLLQIGKVTLYKYQRDEKIKEYKLPNGYWNWDEESFFFFFNEGIPRKKYVYTRFSTKKQKPDLENQIQLNKQWCFSNGIQLNGMFSDVVSGITFEKRKNFLKILEDILQKLVKKVIITYKDRLSSVSFELFSYLFKQFGTEIMVISEVGNPKLDSQEVMEEIIPLIHCIVMKMYSKRKRKFIQELIKVV